MSILDQQAPEAYTFASTGIETFIDNLKSPIQEMEIEEPSDFEPQPEPEPEPPSQEPQQRIDIQMTAAAARSTGTLLAIVTDSAIPSLLCTLAGDADTSLYKATESEFTALQTAFTEYSRQQGTDIPPGMALLLAVASIYGIKVPLAIQKRKNNLHP